MKLTKFIIGLLGLTTLGVTAFAGPAETSTSKDTQTFQAQAPVEQFYGDREWNFDLFGTYAFAGNRARADRYLNQDHAFGGGLDVNYFFCRYLGVGLEGYALDADDVIGQLSSNLVLRYPIPNTRFAPYGYAGGGVLFNGSRVENAVSNDAGPERVRRNADVEGLGQFGGGFEVRVTKHIGLINDFSWNVVNGAYNNYGLIRSGIRFAF